MPIPSFFNPLGVGVSTPPPPPVVYKEFVQPVMLSNTEIDKTKPYSFGMAITNDYDQPTAWQAFDGDPDTLWQLSGNPVKLILEFEHSIILEKVSCQWANYVTAFQLRTLDNVTLLNKVGAAAKASAFTLDTPTEVAGVIFGFVGSGGALFDFKFIGKYTD